MTPLRRQFYTSSSHTDVFAQLIHLEGLYLKTFGRRMETELFFSSQGDCKDRSTYGVTAYYAPTPAGADEVEWLENNVKT